MIKTIQSLTFHASPSKVADRHAHENITVSFVVSTLLEQENVAWFVARFEVQEPHGGHTTFPESHTETLNYIPVVFWSSQLCFMGDSQPWTNGRDMHTVSQGE